MMIAVSGESPPKAILVTGKPVVALSSKTKNKIAANCITNLLTAREVINSTIINIPKSVKKIKSK